MKIRNCHKVGIVIVIGIVLALGLDFSKEKNNKVSKEELKNTVQEINNMCNSVYENVDEAEIKYLDLFEKETDPLKKGMYSSTLLQVYSIKADYDKVVKYGEEAVKNYMKVEGGVYYAISENKYLIWTMFGLGRYSESFKKSHELIDLIELHSGEYLDANEIRDAEALVNSILLMIYSEFNLKDNAKIYYDKLCEIEMSDELEFVRGEKLAFSKMIYAEKINDYELMKYYAEEIYRISIKNDKLKDVSTAEATMMDVAHANIKLGNLEEGLEQLQKAEKFIVEINSEYSLGEIYKIYGGYYDIVGDVEKATEYYKKAIEIQEKIGDEFKIYKIIKEFTEFCERRGLDEYLGGNNRELFALYNNRGIDGELGQLLIEAVEINDKLNYQKLEYLQRQSDIVKNKNIVVIIITIILLISIVKMKKIIKIKAINEKKLEKIINNDYLTQVNTRAYGYKQIIKLVSKKQAFSIGILDIDNFKKINDDYGHLFGDEILKSVA
ncbi:MAG: diguanylate cyclase domain-containing protein, partial [Clostridium sp.]